MSTFKYSPLGSGSGSGSGVSSLNTLTGALTLAAGAGITITPSGGDTLTIDATGAAPTGTPNTMSIFDSLGALASSTVYSIDTTSLGLVSNRTLDINNEAVSHNFENSYLNAQPISASPNDQVVYRNVVVEIDANDTGFGLGDAGNSLFLQAMNVTNASPSSMGAVNFLAHNMNIGNGTDPISMRGLTYAIGYGQINANVDVNGPLQGYGFQPNMQAGSTTSGGLYGLGFFDSANINTQFNGQWTSFNAVPAITEITNNFNYNGLNIAPAIDDLTGNAGFYGVIVQPQTMNLDSGTWMGLSVNPQSATLASGNAYGINVSMDNVNVFAGTASSLVIQDITYTFNAVGDSNSYQIEYVSDTTAGNESVTIAGLLVTVHMETAVSTATQIKAAWDANISAASAVAAVITGTASNAQVSAAAANFTGGANPAQKLAAYLDGDVQITGALTFGGALSVGRFNAFDSEPLVSGSGVTSIHSIISNTTVPASATITGADRLGVNTAGLINIGDNASVTTSFLGIAALGLPAVLAMGTGSTVDKVSGATFALSLDATATGGTAAQVNLCDALLIPNGVTSVTKLVGYNMTLPFGSAGVTDVFGVFITPEVRNVFKGSVLVGGDETLNSVDNAVQIAADMALQLGSATTASRDAMAADDGMMVFNSDTATIDYYDGTAWTSLGSGGGGVTNPLTSDLDFGGFAALNVSDITDGSSVMAFEVDGRLLKDASAVNSIDIQGRNLLDTSGSPALTWTNGDVGIGTTGPRRKLELNSGSGAGPLFLSGQTSGDVGFAIDFDTGGGSTNIQSTDGALSAVRALSINASGGLITIGDALRLGRFASDPTVTGEGWIYYNTTTNKIKMYNGTSWETVTSV